MSKLDDLYEGKIRLERAGYKLTREMLQDMDQLEEQLIKDEVLPTLSKDIEPRLNKIQRDLVLVVEYHPGEPISVALSRKAKISEILGAKTLTPKNSKPVKSEMEPAELPEHEPTKHVENTTKGMRVTFPDGTVIWHQAAIDTFIDTLRKIGLEKIPEIGILHSGYNLVGKDKRPPEPGRIWQHESDGWYVYSNISNPTKAKDLKQISDYYHLSLIIEEGKPSSPKIKEKHRREIAAAKTSRSIARIEQFQSFVLQNHDPSTARYYSRLLDVQVREWISKLVDNNADSIFGYQTLEEVRMCIDLLKNDSEFMKINKQKHNAYTAALNKYYQFLQSKKAK